MKILQSLNQNALLVSDEGREFIIIGKGIGYGKKKGDVVENEEVSKYYKIKNSENENRVQAILEELDEEVIFMAEKIAKHAQVNLQKELNESFIFSLASHIKFTEEKYQSGIDIPEPFHYELRYLYPKEYRVAEWAVRFLNSEYDMNLPKVEISFFILHFVNGLLENEQVNNAVELSEILNDIVEIVEDSLDRSLDRNSLEFSRFIIHIRYFILRIHSREKRVRKGNENIDKLKAMTTATYPREHAIVHEIKQFLKQMYNIEFNSEEDFYLLLHLVRISN
ncbi:MAG: PRD domain-containing protein [Breznakia sp.]